MEIKPLKRCPFCNGKPQLNTCYGKGYIDKDGVLQYTTTPYIIQCINCGCETYPYEQLEDAMSAWNRRDGC